MISAIPTQNLTGITLQGDFNDFYALVDSIHRLYGSDDNVYYEVKNRFLGISYEIRHALMGNRDVILQENGMNKDLMSWHNIKTSMKNVYFSVNSLFPKAIFFAISAPKVYSFSASYYGEKGKKKSIEPFLSLFPYSDYLIDKANIDVFCAIIWQALGSVIVNLQLEKIIHLVNKSKENYIDYVTQYIDKCNIELIKTDPEKRKKKLKNITERMIKKPSGYIHLEKELKYWAKKYNSTIHELDVFDTQYLSEIVW